LGTGAVGAARAFGDLDVVVRGVLGLPRALLIRLLLQND
jgi:hypothetical protein